MLDSLNFNRDVHLFLHYLLAIDFRLLGLLSVFDNSILELIISNGDRSDIRMDLHL